MSRRQLTQKQHAFLEFLRGHVDCHQVWPTYREIVEHFEYRSPNSVTQNLQALSRKGFLRRDRDGYALVDTTGDDGSIPVRGRLCNGHVQPEADRLSLTAFFPGVDGLYAVRLDNETERPAELAEAVHIFVAPPSGTDGETLAVTDAGRLALAETAGDAEVLGRYVGHAGPYGVVRHQDAVAEGV